MMKVEILGIPHFSIALELHHIDMLMECATVHYDHVCKAAARPGGFLYGWSNRAAFYANDMAHRDSQSKEDAAPFYVSATMRELSTASKILEIASHVYVGPQAERTAKRMRCLALSAAFDAMAENARQAAQAWHAEFDA